MYFAFCSTCKPAHWLFAEDSDEEPHKSDDGFLYIKYSEKNTPQL